MRCSNFTLSIIALLFTGSLLAQQTSGIASYYAPGFDGQPTSTGEKYDHNDFTAASREYRVGTILRVIRVDDGRSVNVRVNDCGPHRRGRIIDLSGAAAIQIGLADQDGNSLDGITQVRLEVVRKGRGRMPCGKSYVNTFDESPTSYDSTGEPTEVTSRAPEPLPIEGQGTYRAEVLQPIEAGYGVQVGSFRYYENADAVVKDLQAKGYGKVLIRLQANVHQVVLGPFETRAAAEVYRDNLWKNYQQKGFVTTIGQ
ncbi:MAG: septal ring lytic transglycosylase RlpA family protein [Bacteroidota bacterium]